jgi:hypothetical protein
VSDRLYIENSVKEDIKVEVYSIKGELLINKKFLKDSEIEINLSDLSEGIYLVHLSTKDKLITKKIVLN